MGSSRLPNKSLMKLHGSTLLETVISSVEKNDFISEIIVATTTLDRDNPIEEKCKSISVRCFRGSENDVLSRFISIAKNYNPKDVMVRVTADNPINNKNASKALFDKHLYSDADYTCIDGLCHTVYEYVKIEALLKLENNEKLVNTDREHVTKYIREHPEEFKVCKISADVFGIDSKLNKLLTVDTNKDFERMLNISSRFELSSEINFNELYSYLNTYV